MEGIFMLHKKEFKLLKFSYKMLNCTPARNIWQYVEIQVRFMSNICLWLAQANDTIKNFIARLILNRQPYVTA